MALNLNIEDLRKSAMRNLPLPIYQYIDSGSYDQRTKTSNSADFDRIALRQRVLMDVRERDQSVTILGQHSTMPIAISPVGLSGILAGGGRGETLTARAAKAAGIPFGLSMLSLAPMEEVRERSNYPFWFHIMPLKDRGFIGSLIDRAAALDAPVLIVTVDWQVPAQIHNNLRNRLGKAPTAKGLMHFLARPKWLLSTIAGGRSLTPGNFKDFPDAAALTENIANILDAGATWDYVRWLRQRWSGKLLVKGILDPADAEAAIDAGADAISVSNHGGTQLDGTLSTIAALPAIVDRVAGRCEILLDSGVRSGHDVVKALALGAQAVLLGRPYLFGLAADGEDGVSRALSIIRGEIDSALGSTGCNGVARVGPDTVILNGCDRTRP